MANILFTGYKSGNKEDINSAELFIKQIKNADTFLFSNDYTLIIDKIDKLFTNKKYNYVVMFVQKPLIKRLSIEMICKQDSECLKNKFPCRVSYKCIRKKSYFL